MNSVNRSIAENLLFYLPPMMMSLKIAFISLILCLAGLTSAGQRLGDDVQISILTCTPGQEIYSLFGHTAVRVNGTIDGQKNDFVYNYGTFEWTDDFTMQFARGKLLYMLSRAPFYAFNHTYIEENRGIEEQFLNLTHLQKTKVFDLLEENYKPENRKYLYDFFYDNCSTRVIDILQDAFGEELVFDFPTPDSTFRDMIQIYLNESHWTDLGIDLGLGLASDMLLEKLDDAFLPDFLFLELASARLGGKPLVLSTETILEAELEEMEGYNQPLFLFGSILIFYVLLIAIRKKMPALVRIFESGFLFISGLIGLFLLTLWFATDHTATANNLNLLWAMPLNLVFPFLKNGALRKMYFLIYLCILALILVAWKFTPQAYNPDFIPFIFLLLLASFRMIRR